MFEILHIHLAFNTRAIEIRVINKLETLYSVEFTPSGWELIQSLSEFLIEEKNILANRLKLEKVILTIGYAMKSDNKEFIEITGRNISTGLPSKTNIYSQDVNYSTSNLLNALVDKIANQINSIVSEYSSKWQFKDEIVLQGEFRYWKQLDEKILDAVNSKLDFNFKITIMD